MVNLENNITFTLCYRIVNGLKDLHKIRKSFRQFDTTVNLSSYLSDDTAYYLEHSEAVMCVWDKLQTFKF
jgi:hypothetical protein